MATNSYKLFGKKYPGFFVVSGEFHNELFKPIDFSKTRLYEIAFKSIESEEIIAYFENTSST